MTNGSVVDTTRDVAVIVGIIDAHRARHVVVARRVEGANMVMTDRCRDVTTTSTGTGTWTRRTSGTHTLCISLKYGDGTPIVMDFDGWTRVPIVSMSRDRRVSSKRGEATEGGGENGRTNGRVDRSGE